MPFSIRPYRRFPVYGTVTPNAGPSQGQHRVKSLGYGGWCLSANLPMRPGETLSLTLTLPNEQWIEVPEAVVRWLRGHRMSVVGQHVRLTGRDDLLSPFCKSL